MKRFDLKEIIGENVESIIQKAVKLEDDDEVMLKHLKRRFYSWEECLQINELKVARLCQHDYMLQLKEIIRLKHKDEMTLVYEPVETSLFNYFNVYKEKRIFLLENNIRVILYQVLQVLSHLHNNNLVHRDIQPENIFINQKGQIKVGNFDSCRLKCKGQMTEYNGNRWYRSPEQVMKISHYNQKIDIFAVGVIMAELYMNKNLFPSSDESDHIIRIFKVLGKISIKDWPQMEKITEDDSPFKEIQNDLIDFDNNLQSNKQIVLLNLFRQGAVRNETFDLMIKMLTVCPFNRWDAKELLKHSYFNKMDETCVIDMQDYQEKLYKNFNIGKQIEFEHKTKKKTGQMLNNIFNGIKFAGGFKKPQ